MRGLGHLFSDVRKSKNDCKSNLKLDGTLPGILGVICQIHQQSFMNSHLKSQL